jgi:hypothetical protein
MPLAIELLKKDILAQGDFFEGDLLSSAVSERTFDYWKNNREDWRTVMDLLRKNADKINDQAILKKIDVFKNLMAD